MIKYLLELYSESDSDPVYWKGVGAAGKPRSSLWTNDASEAWSTVSKDVAEAVLSTINALALHDGADFRIREARGDNSYLCEVIMGAKVVVNAATVDDAKDKVQNGLDYGDFVFTPCGHGNLYTITPINDVDRLLRSDQDIKILK